MQGPPACGHHDGTRPSRGSCTNLGLLDCNMRVCPMSLDDSQLGDACSSQVRSSSDHTRTSCRSFALCTNQHVHVAVLCQAAVVGGWVCPRQRVSDVLMRVRIQARASVADVPAAGCASPLSPSHSLLSCHAPAARGEHL